MPEVVLVAGRGPLAVRAIRSCQDSGAKVVAVHSEADTHSLHVRSADEAVLVGASEPESSYLNVAALVEAALVTNAQAILPVHAALAGSRELARATTEAGLLWIGPDEHALEAVESADWKVGRGGTGQASPGWVIGVTDGYRIDGVVVRRARAEGVNLCWTSAEERAEVAIEGLPSAALVLARISERIVDLGWRGLVCVGFGPEGLPVSVVGGIPAELGLVELRAGRDLVRSAIALAEDATPPGGTPGFPAAVGCSIRAQAVPGDGQHTSITDVTGPTGEDVRWEPGYLTGDSLWPWYDPLLATVAVPGDDLAGALSAFLAATSGVNFDGAPNDLDKLREGAGQIAGKLGPPSR